MYQSYGDDLMTFYFFFSSRRRHTRCSRDWSSDVCSSDLTEPRRESPQQHAGIAPTWKPIVQTARTSALARALPMTQTVNLALTNCSLRDEPRGTPVRRPLLAPRGASKPLRRCSRIEPSRRGSESR